MIQLSNVTLRVKKIRGGRYGDFCLGDLYTDIGHFKVKDPLLDQFDDGDYHGNVWISEIYLSQYISFGKGVTEIRAKLHDLQIDSASERPAEREPAEPDPILEQPRVPAQPDEPVTPVQPVQTQAATPPAGTSFREKVRQRLSNGGTRPVASSSSGHDAPAAPADAGPNLSPELQALLEEFVPQIRARQPVKLDPTVERVVLRRQAAAMAQMGYSLRPTEQTWYPSN